MNPIHPVPVYVELHSRMILAHEHPQFDPQRTRELQEHVASLFACEPDFGGIPGIEHATMIQFRNPQHLGKADSIVKHLIQLPLYFQEVREFVPLGELQLHQRALLADATGHLLMGRDETVAVLHQIASGHIFCDTFEVNTDGVARSIAGFDADTVANHSEPQYIAKLNATEVEKAISRAMSEIYWWSDQSQAFNPVQIERMRKTVRLLRAHEKSAPDERTSTGAVIRRSFIPNGSTASVSPVLQRDAGWRHYPTSSDAWYFGVWINPALRQTLSYIEQDVAHVFCDNDEQFHQELARMAAFFGANRLPSAMSYGEDGSVAYFDSLFLIRGVHRIARLEPGAREGNQWTAPLFGAISLEHPAVLALNMQEMQVLPVEAFELDKLDPRAFVAHTVHARLTPNGYAVEIRFSDGLNLECVIDPKRWTTEK